MASKTELANKALTLCGAEPITNLDDEAQNARIVNRVYDISLKSILSECAWTFAIKRKSLSESADTLDWYDTGETIVYAKPSDVIRIIRANDKDAAWRIHKDYIVSDTDDLGIEYVYYLDDPTKYSSSFTEAFIDKLCSDICFMIVNSKSMAQAFLEKYESVSLPKAMAENAQAGTQQTPHDDAWTKAKDFNEPLEA